MSLCLCQIDNDLEKKTLKAFMRKYNLTPYVKRAYDKNMTLYDNIFNFCDTAAHAPYFPSTSSCTNYVKWLRKLSLMYRISRPQVAADKIFDEIDNMEDTFIRDNYDIGYGHFNSLREKIAPFFGAKYYYAKYHDKAKTKPVLSSYKFDYPDYWHSFKSGKALYNFFMHNNCDGLYNVKDTQDFARVIKKGHIIKHVLTDLKQDPQARQIAEVLNFILNTADHGYYIKFN